MADDEKTEGNDKLQRKCSERVGTKKKYRILSQRKRKSCPSIFTDDDNVTAEHYLQLADNHYSAGNLETAAKYYSVILGRQMKKDFSIADDTGDEIDENNNNSAENNENKLQINHSEWAENFLDAKFMKATNTIAMSTDNSEGYLEMAAVLFFQNKWEEARKILETGMELCTIDKNVLKNTMEEMDKIKKSTIIGV